MFASWIDRVTYGNRNYHARRYSGCPARASDCESRHLIIEPPLDWTSGRCMSRTQHDRDELLFSIVRPYTCSRFNRAIVSGELGPTYDRLILPDITAIIAAFLAQYSQFYFSLRYRKEPCFYARFLRDKWQRRSLLRGLKN